MKHYINLLYKVNCINMLLNSALLCILYLNILIPPDLHFQLLNIPLQPIHMPLQPLNLLSVVETLLTLKYLRLRMINDHSRLNMMVLVGRVRVEDLAEL